MELEDSWGRWEAAPLGEVVALMRGLAAPWWVGGGYAIQLAVGHAYREHEDVDIVLLRRDQLEVRRLLDGWDFHVPGLTDGLRPWALDEVLPGQAHNVWVRERPGGPWRFELLLEDVDGQEWIYRRDRRIRRPLAELTVEADGLRLVAPEVQLLYKAKGTRRKDEVDFEAILPRLTQGQRCWLEAALEVGHDAHPWRERLRHMA
ncbi:nucleotidyltransferase domain-containing protein [Nonomuraea fastidiosa]|uniref:nucleotidyltransferase domain-containing protein n=1 Tax=Nonomuraea TaxID=83681 RepID=UPI003245F388